MKYFLQALFVATLFSTSEIVTQKMIAFDVFKTSFTIVWREERHPIAPTEGADTYKYYKDIYTVNPSSGTVNKLKTISPSRYVPSTSTDEIIEWAE